MDQAALFSKNIYIYWHGIFMGISILLAIITALIFCAALQKHRTSTLLRTIAVAIPFGIIFARILYCISNFEEFKGLDDILTMTDGGYALYGGIIGVFFAAVIMRALGAQNKIGTVCDCMAIGGALGIAAGRMASYFSYDNVGIVMINEKYHFFPLSVYDAASNQWFLATFTMEAVTEFLIFIVLCITFIRNNNEKKGMRGREGDIALLFIMMHSAAEAVFDSMHTDALRFPGNSFIRLQQIIGAVFFAVIAMVFLARSINVNKKFKFYHFVSFVFIYSMMGICIFMELDRISDTNYFSHHMIMFAALFVAVIFVLMLYKSTLKDNITKTSSIKNSASEG